MTSSMGRTGSGRRSLRRPAAGVGVVAIALLAAMLTPTAVQATSAPSEAASAAVLPSSGVVAPIPTLNWHPCFGGDLECTSAQVPLDYDDPTGETTRIFMSKQAATDPGNKIGTLFVNPGGPGGPSSQVVEYFAAALRSRHLGTLRHHRYRSARNRPQHTSALQVDPSGTPLPPQLGTAQRGTSQAADPVHHVVRHRLRRGLQRDPRSHVDSGHGTGHGSDQAGVGDAQLCSHGISYGTYLGATYAAMFPDQVRAVVLDGVLDPIAWSTGRPGFGNVLPFSTRLRSGVGAWDALVSAFNECDRVGKVRCSFAGEAGAKWASIIKRLKHGPAKVSGGNIVYSDVIGGALGALYNRDSYRFLMREISFLYREMFVKGHRSPARSTSSPRFASSPARSQVPTRLRPERRRVRPQAGFGRFSRP